MSTNNWKEMTPKHTNNPMQEKPNNFGKRQAMMEYMDSGSINPPTFTTDKH